MFSSRLIGSILMIAGTSIGAGMLALPVVTAKYGFWPAIITFFICWLVLLFSALLILEVNRWFPVNTNFITMVRSTLGIPGQIVAWLSFLLLLYALMSAYLSGMDALIGHASTSLFALNLQAWQGAIFLIVIFGFIIYLGVRSIDYINRLLMIGMVLAYFILIGGIIPHIDVVKLAHKQFSNFWLVLPIVTTSFGYHIIIPSIRSYLQDDFVKIKWAIIIGSSLPFFVYVLWELAIVGVLPTTGEHGLLSILEKGQPAVQLPQSLSAVLQATWLPRVAKFFSFFAIATSFIGVAFSLFDFLVDGLHIKKSRLGRISTALLTFFPPFIFVMLYPRAYILALGYAGIFVAILLGILPALMAWRGRYMIQIAKGFRTAGGKLALSILLIFFIFVIYVELT